MNPAEPILTQIPRLRKSRELKITDAAISRLTADVRARLDRIECGLPPIVQTKPKTHHERIMWIPQAMMLDVFAGRLSISNIPDGAELVSMWQEPVYDGLTVIDTYLCLRIKHESFPEVEEGRQIPRVTALLRKPILSDQRR